MTWTDVNNGGDVDSCLSPDEEAHLLSVAERLQKAEQAQAQGRCSSSNKNSSGSNGTKTGKKFRFLSFGSSKDKQDASKSSSEADDGTTKMKKRLSRGLFSTKKSNHDVVGETTTSRPRRRSMPTVQMPFATDQRNNNKQQHIIEPQEETWRAMALGEAVLVQCPKCLSHLQSASKTRYFQCPRCKTLSPIDVADNDGYYADRNSILDDYSIAKILQHQERQCASNEVDSELRRRQAEKDYELAMRLQQQEELLNLEPYEVTMKRKMDRRRRRHSL
eukprot:CAMPEP_0196813888 /NCGR_PEP_ID=MMETSP1362-20130617/39899_1 /TAXON_ID=163516 /ORGANISM="Leptocylindrus danicus, Strain CCMP1856" /LENGTH=275 /DNA_ID=CAMNT_0042190313 /DNA_START=60 /DNA_END=887 /DNA_ORIENTATION=-